MPPSSVRSRWVDVALALLILVAGLYVRLVDLGGQSLDTDELLHFFAAESLVQSGEPTLPGGLVYGRAGWFTETVAASFRAFGPGESAARLPGALFGAAVVPLVYWMGVSWFGRTAAIFAALAVALVPFNVVHSRQARMYAPFQLLFVFGVFAFYRGLNEAPRRAAVWLLSAAAALTVAYKTHLLTGLFAPTAAIYTAATTAVIGWARGLAAALRSRYAAIALLLIVGGVVALVLNPWILDAVVSMRGQQFGSRYATSGSLYFNLLRRPWMFPLGAALIVGVAQTLIERNRAGTYAIVVAGSYLAFLSTSAVQQSRYLIHVFPLIALIAGFGIAWIVEHQTAAAVASLSVVRAGDERRLLSARGRSIAVAALIGGLWLLPAAGWARQSLRAATTAELSVYGALPRPSWREACAYVLAHGDEDTPIVASTPLGALRYCGRVDFGVDGDSWIGSRQYSLAGEEAASAGKRPHRSTYLDPYSGAAMILTLDDLLLVQETHPSGWFLVEAGHLDEPRYVSPRVRDHVVRTFREHDIGVGGSILAFDWTEGTRRKTP